MKTPHRGQGSGGWTDRRKFNAVCSQCGKECEVPFKPSGNRPVFCTLCFKKDGNQGQRQSQGADFRRSFDQKPSFKAVCEKCGAACEVPFRPNGSKPVYCKTCFAGSDTAKNSNTEQTKEQFKIVNAKLDAILKILKPPEIELDEKAIDEKADAPEKPAKKKAAKKKK